MIIKNRMSIDLIYWKKNNLFDEIVIKKRN